MISKIKPMTSGPIWKRMMFFAFPLMLGNLFQQLYNTVDSIIVGNILGSNALAAVSSSGSLIFMMVGFFGGIAGGAGVVVARYFGAEDNDNLHLAVHTMVASGLVAGVILTLIGVFLSPQILIWMGTPNSVMNESVTYMKIYFAGSIGFVMYNIFVGILQAVGDGKHPLYYLITSSVINFLLDFLFIGYLKTGVGGAALATIISQFISAILCLILLIRTNEVYRLQLKKIRFEPVIFKKIIRIGLPSGFQNAIIAFANVVVQANINSFGTMAMAGNGAYSKVEGFAFMPIMSLNMAITTFVGQNLGADLQERTKKGAQFGVLISVILAQIVGIIIFIFAPNIISAFDSNPEVVRFGVEKARTATLFYFLLAYSHANAAILRGSGKTKVPMFIMLAFWCVFRISFLNITVPLTQNILMVYIVYPLTWGLSSIAFFIYKKKVNWEQLVE